MHALDLEVEGFKTNGSDLHHVTAHSDYRFMPVVSSIAHVSGLLHTTAMTLLHAVVWTCVSGRPAVCLSAVDARTDRPTDDKTTNWSWYGVEI